MINGYVRKLAVVSVVAVLGLTGCAGGGRPATAGPSSSPSPSASPAVRAPVAGECLTDTYTTLPPFDRNLLNRSLKGLGADALHA